MTHTRDNNDTAFLLNLPLALDFNELTSASANSSNNSNNDSAITLGHEPAGYYGKGHSNNSNGGDEGRFFLEESSNLEMELNSIINGEPFPDHVSALNDSLNDSFLFTPTPSSTAYAGDREQAAQAPVSTAPRESSTTAITAATTASSICNSSSSSSPANFDAPPSLLDQYLLQQQQQQQPASSTNATSKRQKKVLHPHNRNRSHAQQRPAKAHTPAPSTADVTAAVLSQLDVRTNNMVNLDLTLFPEDLLGTTDYGKVKSYLRKLSPEDQAAFKKARRRFKGRNYSSKSRKTKSKLHEELDEANRMVGDLRDQLEEMSLAMEEYSNRNQLLLHLLRENNVPVPDELMDDVMDFDVNPQCL